MSADLERDLRELRVAWPPTPDLSGPVVARIAEEGVSGRAWRRRRAPHVSREGRGRRRLALAAAVAALLVPAGAAFGDDVLRWLGLTGVEVERRNPPDDARRPARDELGASVTLAEAGRRAGFTPVLPAALGTPEEVRLDGRVVTLVHDGGDLLLAQLPGALERNLLRKIADPRAIREVPEGLFFTGDHAYLYLRPGGEVAEDRPRLAGSTLVTQRGDLVLRLEGRGLTYERARRLLR